MVISRLPLLACLLAAVASPAERVQLPTVIGEIRSAVDPERAMAVMRRVHETDRWSTFPKYRETIDYLSHTLGAAGLKDIEISEAPADGVTQVGYWTMPLAWDAKRARLEIVEPHVPDESRVLADFEQAPASLGMWSGPTPPGGIVAEVVEISRPSRAALEGADVKGKLVLTTGNPAFGKHLLVRSGALGAINAFTENRQLRDGRQWVNSWGDYGWGYTKSSTPLLSFSITPRQLELVRSLMKGGRTVKVKATVESRYYTGGYPYITALVPGAGDEEVLALGHTAEYGAHDNATGVSAMVESLTLLNKLIGSGTLARPKRGIRMLAMPEMYGSLHYVATHPERMRKTVAAICLDTPAGWQHLAGTEYTFHLNPHVSKSYTDALILRVAAEYFPKVGRPYHGKPYATGTDTWLVDPMVGVPTVWPYSGTGVHTHHNSEDKPDQVDPKSLRDLTVVTAAYLYYLASAGPEEAKWLVEITTERGYGEILEAASKGIDQVMNAGSGRAVALHEAVERIRYQTDREEDAVWSVRRLVPDAPVERALHDLELFRDRQIERLRAVAGVEAVAPPPDPQIEAGRGIVVKRKRFGTLPLDDIPPDEREGFPSASWSVPLIAALNWCDGKRDLAEVIRLTRHEVGPLDFDFAGYFRFLAKRGYVEIANQNEHSPTSQ